jgi:hypothetical protein
VSLHDKIYYGPAKNHDIQIFITSYTDKGIVIREEVRVGNFILINVDLNNLRLVEFLI